jgi:hypothetical protein
VGIFKKTSEAIASMDAEGNLPSEQADPAAEAVTEAQVAQEAEPQAFQAEPEEAEVPVEWAQFLEAEADEAPDGLEINFYGQSFKEPAELEKFVNSHFTQKSQEIAEYKRQIQSQVELERQELLRQRQELAAWKQRVEEHLGQGGDAEDFYEQEGRSQENQRLAEMQRQMDELRRERETAQAQQQIEAQLVQLGSQFPLIQNPGIVSEEDVRRNAIASVLASGNQIPLDHAYVQEVQKANKKLRSLKKNLLTSKVRASRENPTGSTSGSGTVPVASARDDYKHIPARRLGDRWAARTEDILKNLPDDFEW